ncbi:MAG: aminoacyl-tRNA hydrolase [Arenimonas sp.]|nr:aminoacyl-tRNA hydrolase [Arenimonas sp.]MBP6310031.1 aminoacyl-tRNA hydrolase [Arenimonas sp.]
MLEVSERIQINDSELIERAIRASGPGGQHVNKVSTAIELRFYIWGCVAIPEEVKQRLAKKRDQRITESGEIIIHAQRFRSQERNREDARARLVSLIQSALEVPKPRLATKPTRASQRRRLDDKRANSTQKLLRQTNRIESNE